MNWLLTVTLIATAAAGTCGLLALSIDRGVTSEGSLKRGESRPPDRLTICVEAVDLSNEVRIRAKLAIESALEELVLHPVWPDTQYSASVPEVLEGCPRGPAVYGRRLAGGFSGVLGRTVNSPSYFAIHLFVLTQEEIERVNGSSPYRHTVEEYQCGGDSCSQVTAGVYIADEEINEPDLLMNLLDGSIGLSVSLVRQ